MDLSQSEREESSPYTQLLKLVLYAIAGVLLSLLISVFILYLVYGTLMSGSWLLPDDPKFVTTSRILISSQQLGLFLGPALFLAFGERQKLPVFYGFNPPKTGLLAFVVVIMAAFMPFMEWCGQINQNMVLPEFLKGLELWMRESEDAAMVTTLALLKMDHLNTYLINIAMIALLPAIAEELMFRGAIQRSFLKMFRNPHLAIWISAFIFSAIHMQFYGFLPRFLLGAGLGYLYFWTRSIWYSVFAHFLNNAYAVTAAWYMQKNNIPLSEADKTTNFQWYGYVISAILTVLLLTYFKNQTQKNNGKQLD